MKPEASLTNLTPEQPAVNYWPNIEHKPGLKVESALQNGAEHYEQKSEIGAVISDVGLTTVLPAPVKSAPIVVDDTTVSDAPLAAGDDDLIEKEWVDKAKKIVKETRDNPHRQEEAVSKLQVDYLKKRYGREIGAT